MRSLYVRIALASFLTVLVSLGAFIAIGRSVMGGSADRLFRGGYTARLEQAVEAYQRGGRIELASLLGRLAREFDREYYMTDASGRDLLTGDDRSADLQAVPEGARRPTTVGNKFMYARTSDDGRYRMLVVGEIPFTMWSFAPFFLLVLGAVIFVSWFVAVSIAAPLRTLAAATDRFGRGDLSARVTYDSHNEIGRVAASFNTMADRIQTLLTAERRLLQDISHELRSPLARLNFSAALARTASDRDASVDRIQRDLDRLSGLVGQLLEVTRVEGDPAVRRAHPVYLDDLLAEVVQACCTDAPARLRRVVVTGTAPRPVSGDRELCRRAVENVLRNALQHAPEHTAVDVDVREDPSQTTITIRDRGLGVPDDSLATIFEAFYRVDPSRDAASGGIGLGLAIAQRAVHLHHGTIVAANASPGLRVTITLPAAV